MIGDPRRRIVSAETARIITDFEEDNLKESASNMIARTSRMRALRRSATVVSERQQLRWQGWKSRPKAS